MKHHYIIIISLLLLANGLMAQTTTPQVQYFDLQDVEMLDNPYKQIDGGFTDEGQTIYASKGNNLYVNLFIPSRLQWRWKAAEIIQENTFPKGTIASLVINPKKPATFTLKLFYPAWVAEGRMTVTVNGDTIPVKEKPGDYISVNRKWKKGDKVEVDLPMKITIVPHPDKPDYYSFRYGPFLLAAKTKSGASDKDVPVIVCEAGQLSSLLKPAEGKPLTFTLSNLHSDKYPDMMELIPLFQLPDSSYITYWEQMNEQELKAMKQEKEDILLEKRTVDRVICGEQQSESDHSVSGENSWTGSTGDESWRETGGWVSYQLKNPGRNARFLYLKYFDQDSSRNFDIYVNWQRVGSLELKGGHSDPKVTIFRIPQSESGKDVLEITLVAHPSSMTAKAIELKLLVES